MNNLLLVGFKPDIDVQIRGYNTIHHAPFEKSERSMSPEEYELLCKKIIESTSIILLNLNKINLSFDESFILFYAYSIDKPIFGVGEVRDNFLEVILTNEFFFLEDAIIHIKNNY